MRSASNSADVILAVDDLVIGMERGAQRRLGLTAAELAEAYHTGALEDAGEVIDLLGLGFLLPENHPLHVRLDG